MTVASERTFRLTDAQEGRWFVHRLRRDGVEYWLGEVLEIHGPIDVALFGRAAELLVAEDEMTRPRIVETPDGPRQLLGEVAPLRTVDISGEAGPWKPACGTPATRSAGPPTWRPAPASR